MYYPKSQIKSNLYTNGGEYILSTTREDYKGHYYEVASGQKFTGKTPQDGINIQLLPPTLNSRYTPENKLDISITTIQYFQPSDDYVVIKNIDISQEKILPQSNLTTPTQQDQSLGIFTRYFCKKNNELKYMEIDKITHDQLKSKDSKIAWDLYTPISTLWYIKGEKEKTYNANKGLITLIEQKQSWYGFTQWFQDKFLKYYLES
jgi:hypothetical protein